MPFFSALLLVCCAHAACWWAHAGHWHAMPVTWTLPLFLAVFHFVLWLAAGITPVLLPGGSTTRGSDFFFYFLLHMPVPCPRPCILGTITLHPLPVHVFLLPHARVLPNQHACLCACAALFPLPYPLLVLLLFMCRPSLPQIHACLYFCSGSDRTFFGVLLAAALSNSPLYLPPPPYSVILFLCSYSFSLPPNMAWCAATSGTWRGVACVRIFSSGVARARFVLAVLTILPLYLRRERFVGVAGVLLGGALLPLLFCFKTSSYLLLLG